MANAPVYLDNSAATRLDERVLEAMKPYFFDIYAVATSEFAYTPGIDAKEALEKARGFLASKLNAAENEFIFTSGSTEASNIAIKGAVLSKPEKKGGHVIVSKIEDFPVLYSARSLEKQGYRVTYLNVDGEGFIDPDGLNAAITDDTLLVSIQHSNQEIGTLQNIQKLAEITKNKGVLFHTDATHSFLRCPIDVKKIPADLITVSGHTIHGPRGIGGLYVRKGTPLVKILDGGYQEFNLRPGVEDIASAVGFAKAAELITDAETAALKNMRDTLIDKLTAAIPDTILNGHRTERLPQNANITFHYVEGESITLHLDMHGVSVNTGSACFSKSLEASHVMMAIGGNHERAHGSIRFTFGRFNTVSEIDFLVPVLAEIIGKLRGFSPLHKQ